MRLSTAETRRRLREVIDRARAGERVEITRRDEVVAVVVSPQAVPLAPEPSFLDRVAAWRAAHNPEAWPDDDPFADVRTPEPGRRVA